MSKHAALSPSRAKDFKQCPLLFRFRVIDRLAEPPSPEALRGTLVHAVLERLFDAPALERTEATAQALLDPLWQERLAASPADRSVVGGGDSAMEEALFLTNFASEVVVVHRRDQLRASKVMAQRAFDNPKISFAWNSTVSEVLGNDSVTGLRLASTADSSESVLDVDGVFVAIGHLPRTGFLAGQVALDPAGYIVVDEPSTRTDVPGVFACGDAVDHTYRQAITAAGSGCRAALDAERWLAERA